jgi:regulator of sigma E protease
MGLITTVAAFLVTLGVLIVIHELGHYWVARRCGVKVLRFSIGFGRPLLRWVRGADRTEWVVAAIPLGGYVRMLDERDSDHPVSADDLPRAFNRQSVGRRTLIVLAGPVANLLLAIGVYWGLNMAGVMQPRALLAAAAAHTPAAQAGVRAGDEVLAVDGDAVRSWPEANWQVLQRAVARKVVELELRDAGGGTRTVQLDLSGLTARDLEAAPLARIGLAPLGGPPQIGRINPGSAAERAGLASGDRVLAVDGAAVASARELIERIRASAGQPLELRLERAGETIVLTAVPALETETAADGQVREIGRLGAELGERRELVRVRYGPVEALALATEKTWDMIAFSLRMIGQMITGDASLKNLSGPVTIADYAGKTAAIGIAAYLSFLALVSISLGVLNLLPIPLLDGGHLVYYLVEVIKGSPPADWVVHLGQRAGIGVLIALTALALYNDLMRLLS